MVQQYKHAVMSQKSVKGSNSAKNVNREPISKMTTSIESKSNRSSKTTNALDSNGSISSASNHSKSSKNSSKNSEDVESVLNSDCFAYIAALSIGRLALVTTVNGDQLQGIVYAVGKQAEVALSDVMLVKDGITLTKEVVPFVCIERKDLVDLSIQDVPHRFDSLSSSGVDSSPSESSAPPEDDSDSEAFLPEDLLEDEALEKNYENIIKETERLILSEDNALAKKDQAVGEDYPEEKKSNGKENMSRENMKPVQKATSGTSSSNASAPPRTNHVPYPGGNKGSQTFHRKNPPRYEAKAKIPVPKAKMQSKWTEVVVGSSTLLSTSIPAPQEIQKDFGPIGNNQEISLTPKTIGTNPSKETVNPWSTEADVWHRRRNKGFSFSDHDCYSTGYERSENFLNPDAPEFVPKNFGDDPAPINEFTNNGFIPYNGMHHMLPQMMPPINVMQSMYPVSGVPVYIPVETAHGGPGYYQHVSHPASPTGGFLVPVVNPMDNYYLAIIHQQQQQQAMNASFFQQFPVFVNNNIDRNSPAHFQNVTPPKSQSETPVTSEDSSDSAESVANHETVEAGA